MLHRGWIAALAVVTILGDGSPALTQTCTGDCDGSGDVTVDEVVTGLNVALGTRNVSECPAFDSSNDGSVTVDEILQAVTNALDGCSTQAPTPTATRSPTPTPPLEPGPLITYFGVVGASNRVATPIGTDGLGRPLFSPTCRNGFFIVVEGRTNPNTGSVEIGRRTFDSDPQNPTTRPDFQLLANRALGNGSAIICDHNGGPDTRPPFGGVPGTNPIDFNPTSQAVANALNDIGCRFTVRTVLDPCTKTAFDNPRFVNTQSSIQFCPELTIDAPWALPLGDTVFAVQLRDATGRLGQRQEIVIRPANDCPPGL